MSARGARAANVDLAHLQWAPESAGRTGIYYLEEASDPRASAVYYDRANSAFANLAPGSLNWGTILRRARALHISGITPALGPGPRAETLSAIRAANAAGVPVARTRGLTRTGRRPWSRASSARVSATQARGSRKLSEGRPVPWRGGSLGGGDGAPG